MTVLNLKYGDWVTGTTAAEEPFGDLLATDGTKMQAGTTRSTRNSDSSDGEVYGVSYDRKLSAPYDWNSPTYYQVWTSTSSPMRPGPEPYEAIDEMYDTDGAVGWQSEGGPVRLVQSQCELLGANGTETWQAWNSAGGLTAYLEWTRTAYDPYTNGRVVAYVGASYIWPLDCGWSTTYKVGALGASAIHQIGYKAYPKDCFVVVQGGGNVPIGALDYQYVDFTAPPPLVSFPGFPPGIVPAITLTVPPATFPTAADTLFESRVSATVWYDCTALFRPWRLVYLTSSVTPDLGGLPVRKLTRYWD